MLRTFTAAALALSLIGGAAFAQNNAPATKTAPVTTSQPAKADAQKTTQVKKHVKHARKAHVKHTRHVRHHVRHVKHLKAHKQVKGVKHTIEKTRG